MPYKDPAKKAAWRALHGAAYQRAYSKTARGKEVAKAGRQTPQGKAKAARKQQRHRARWPERDGARWTVRNALLAGAIQKPARCEGCKERAPLEAHHYMGYAREHWRTVRWLCKPCHRLEE